MSESAIAVIDAPAHHRYEITVDGALAGFTQYRDNDQVRTFPHTLIEPEFGGRGLATQLIRQALDHTRDQGKSVIPLCEAVQRFISKNTGYAELVPADRRAEFGINE